MCIYQWLIINNNINDGIKYYKILINRNGNNVWRVGKYIRKIWDRCISNNKSEMV